MATPKERVWDVYAGDKWARVIARTKVEAQHKAAMEQGSGGRFKWRAFIAKKSNPARKRKGAKKKSTTKRIGGALAAWLKKQNPAFKRARGVRVQRLKGGVIKFKPEF